MTAETDTHRSLERLHEAQRIGQVGDWEYRVADEAITWSPQVFQITGRDRADGPPPTWDELASIFEPDSADRMRRHVDRAAETGEAQTYDLVLVRPDGARRHVQASALARTDEQGQVVTLYGTIHDVTARHVAERLIV